MYVFGATAREEVGRFLWASIRAVRRWCTQGQVPIYINPPSSLIFRVSHLPFLVGVVCSRCPTFSGRRQHVRHSRHSPTIFTDIPQTLCPSFSLHQALSLPLPLVHRTHGLRQPNPFKEAFDAKHIPPKTASTRMPTSTSDGT